MEVLDILKFRVSLPVRRKDVPQTRRLLLPHLTRQRINADLFILMFLDFFFSPSGLKSWDS